ncbi:MAG: hypothetical protein V4677_14605 [Bacteroidota bacterium]
MSRSKHICLYLISCAPILWTILILGCAFFDIHTQGLEMAFIYAALFYVYGGLYLWILTLITLRFYKKITTKQMIIHIALMLLGMMAAYLSLVYNVFCVSGCFFD